MLLLRSTIWIQVNIVKQVYYKLIIQTKTDVTATGVNTVDFTEEKKTRPKRSKIKS